MTSPSYLARLRTFLDSRSLASHVSLQFVQTIWDVMVRTVTVLVAARFLGQELFGVLGLFLNVLALFQKLCDAMAISLCRSVASLQTTNPARAVGTALGGGLLFWGLMLVAVAGGISLVGILGGDFFRTYFLAIALCAVYGGFLFLRLLFEAGFRGLGRFLEVTRPMMVFSALMGVLSIVALLVGGKLNAYLGVMAVVAMVHALVLWRSLGRGIEKVWAFLPIGEFRALLLYSLPLIGRGFLGFLSLRANVFFIQGMASPRELGDYILAERFLMLPLLATGAYVVAVSPRVSSLMAEGRTDALVALARRSIGYLFWLMLPLSIALVLLAFVLPYGFPEYELAGPILILFAIPLTFAAWGAFSSGALLTYSGHGALVGYLAAGCAASNVLMLLILVPGFGAMGAALAFSLNTALWGLVEFALAIRILGITTRGVLRVPFTSRNVR